MKDGILAVYQSTSCIYHNPHLAYPKLTAVLYSAQQLCVYRLLSSFYTKSRRPRKTAKKTTVMFSLGKQVHIKYP